MLLYNMMGKNTSFLFWVGDIPLIKYLLPSIVLPIVNTGIVTVFT